jgi:hypothetical protein
MWIFWGTGGVALFDFFRNMNAPRENHKKDYDPNNYIKQKTCHEVHEEIFSWITLMD